MDGADSGESVYAPSDWWAMMDKVKNLKEKARVFHALLEKYASNDADAESLLRWLTPLFVEVERGGIIPPHRYEFRVALGKESDFYACHREVHSAESDFMCALEDWDSQEWYSRLKGDGS